MDQEGEARATSSRVDDLEINELRILLDSFGEVTQRADLVEIFNPGNFAKHAPLFGLTPGGVYDLRTGWNLSDAKQRDKVWCELEEQEPELIIGSPMCGPFSQLQNLNKDSPEYKEKLKEAAIHLRWIMKIYKWQVS